MKNTIFILIFNLINLIFHYQLPHLTKLLFKLFHFLYFTNKIKNFKTTNEFN